MPLSLNHGEFARGAATTNMCFASPKERTCHSHNSVEMTPFQENGLGTVSGKAACGRGGSLLVAVTRRSRGGFLFESARL